MRPEYPFDRQASAKLLADEETFGFVLMVILLAAYGPDTLFGSEEDDADPMDPVILWASIEEDFGIDICVEHENRINALMTALTTDAFYDEPAVFAAVSMTLTDGDLGDAIAGVFDDLTVPELLWAVLEVSLVRDDDAQFSPAVEQFIGEVLAGEAEDNEMAVEDLDEAHELERYYDRFIRDNMLLMGEQLSALGVPGTQIARIVSQRPFADVAEVV